MDFCYPLFRVTIHSWLGRESNRSRAIYCLLYSNLVGYLFGQLLSLVGIHFLVANHLVPGKGQQERIGSDPRDYMFRGNVLHLRPRLNSLRSDKALCAVSGERCIARCSLTHLHLQYDSKRRCGDCSLRVPWRHIS